MENRSLRHLITVVVETSSHGYTNGNLEYSSTIVSIYFIFEEEGRGPLKSMLSLSKGCAAFIRGGLYGLKNWDFSLAQASHEAVIFLTSSMELERSCSLRSGKSVQYQGGRGFNVVFVDCMML